MKEKLEQEIKHFKQKVNQEDKISKRLGLIALLWMVPAILGFIALGIFAEELFESFLKSSWNKIGFVVWVLVVIVLMLIVVFRIEYIEKLKKKLRGAERKLDLKNFLDEFLDELEVTIDSEKKKILVEKILKEAE